MQIQSIKMQDPPNKANSLMPMKPSPNTNPSAYKKAEDKVWGDMHKGNDRTRKSDSDKAKELDMANATGIAAQQAKPVQDKVDTDTNVSQDAISQTDSSTNKGIVDILEGIGMQDEEAEGTVPDDAFNSLLEAVTQTEDTDMDAEIIHAGMLNQTNTQPTVGRPDSLENINNADSVEDGITDSATNTKQGQGVNSLLHMMQQAVTHASKKQQGNADKQDDQKQTLDYNTMAVRQESRVEGIDSKFQEAAASQQPVSAGDMAENVSRLVQSIQANAVDGKQEFMVQLKPEFLGRLSIKLVMDHDGIRAQIKASDMTSKNLIQNGLPALEETLKERGIDVKQIEIAYEPPKFDFNQQQNTQNGWYFSQEKQNRYPILAMEQDNFTGFFEMADAIDQYTQNSSMEFRA